MPSFRTLSLIATLACAAFSAAAPAAPAFGSVTEPAKLGLPLLNDGPSKLGGLGSLNPRTSDIKSLPTILDIFTTQAKPHCDKLSGLTTVDITVEVVVGLCGNLKDLLVVAIADCKKLQGLPIEVVLGVAGKVDIKGIAVLVAGVLQLVLGALACVLKVVVSVGLVVLIPILKSVGCLVGELVLAILLIVKGLLVELVPLCGGLTGIIFELKLDVLIKCFGL